MPSLTPSGGFALSLSAVRNLVAYTAAWHTWTGVIELDEEDRFAAALRRVHYYAIPAPANPDGYVLDELQALRPACIVTPRPPLVVSRSAEIYNRFRVSGETFIENYTHYVYLMADVPEIYRQDNALAFLDFTNKVGALIDGMLTEQAVSHTEDVPYVQGIAMVLEPYRPKQEQAQTIGDVIETVLRINCGLKR